MKIIRFCCPLCGHKQDALADDEAIQCVNCQKVSLLESHIVAREGEKGVVEEELADTDPGIDFKFPHS